MLLLCSLWPGPREKGGVSDSQTIKLLLLFLFSSKNKNLLQYLILEGPREPSLGKEIDCIF